jgi:pyruvate formate lyase activating enzyme
MINISGFEKSSLLDYPGKIAAVIFTHACNLRCPYCHNPELVLEPFDKNRSFTEEYVLDFLKKRVGKLDGVVITGGEPLIQVGLEDFITKIKELGFLVKLDTNGMSPNKLQKILDLVIVDCIAMDVKYPKEGYGTFLGVEDVNKKIQKSIEIIMNSGLEYEFRTTYVKGMHTIDSVKGILEMISGASNYYIQNFRSGKSIDPELSPQNSFTDEELKEFEVLAKKYVDFVAIRN